jgi:hypothetical protein
MPITANNSMPLEKCRLEKDSQLGFFDADQTQQELIPIITTFMNLLPQSPNVEAAEGFYFSYKVLLQLLEYMQSWGENDMLFVSVGIGPKLSEPIPCKILATTVENDLITPHLIFRKATLDPATSMVQTLTSQGALSTMLPSLITKPTTAPPPSKPPY